MINRAQECACSSQEYESIVSTDIQILQTNSPNKQRLCYAFSLLVVDVSVVESTMWLIFGSYCEMSFCCRDISSATNIDNIFALILDSKISIEITAA